MKKKKRIKIRWKDKVVLSKSMSGGKMTDKKFIKESREIYENNMKNITEKNPIVCSKLANQYWNEHLKRIGIN